MKHIFYSKVDWWLILLCYGLSIAPATALLIDEFSWAILIIIASMTAVITFLLFSMKYTVSGDTLSVKCGFISYGNYNISKIKSIRTTRTILSAPASSLDRIEIKFEKGLPLVLSPRNKQEFVAKLQQINPNIQSLI